MEMMSGENWENVSLFKWGEDISLVGTKSQS